MRQNTNSFFPSVSPRSGAEAYNDPSWWYDLRGFFILMGTYQVTLWSHVRFFGRNIRGTHLEAAVGSGTFLWITLALNRLSGRARPRQIVGIDYAQRMLDGARRLFRRTPWVTLCQGDLSKIDHPDETFDTINIAHSFHAFPQPSAVLAELLRVMKPGATLRVDVLLHPRGGKLRQGLANRVNAFCFNKGILARTCNAETTRRQFIEQGFALVHEDIHGNTLNLIVQKPAA